MNPESGIESYVRNPRLLVELIVEVVDCFGNGQDESATNVMEAQLREVAKAIDNLDKAGIGIPDALRAEKTRLAAALGIQAEAMQVLSLLTDELDDIVKNLKSRLGKWDQTKEKKTRTHRSRAPNLALSVSTLQIEDGNKMDVESIIAGDEITGQPEKQDIREFRSEKGYYIDYQKFCVLKNSRARETKSKAFEKSSYANLRERLIKDEVLLYDSEWGEYIFTKDYIFDSPSAAACVVDGNSRSGNVAWGRWDEKAE